MSGHSKWSNIKRKKEANDKVKGSVFTKLSRLITIAVIDGGGVSSPDHNFRLRLAIEKAKKFNMPKENIEKAIRKGTGPNKSLLKEIVYEGFAPGGVALMILTTTDNQNRTFSEVKNMLEKRGGKMAGKGAVNYLFNKCGLVVFKKKDVSENIIFEIAQNLKAEDIDNDNQYFYLYIPFEMLGKIKEITEIRVESSDIDYKAKTPIEASDEEKDRLLKLIESLEEMDDVHRVFHNLK